MLIPGRDLGSAEARELRRQIAEQERQVSREEGRLAAHLDPRLGRASTK
jgi:hypothetical protein